MNCDPERQRLLRYEPSLSRQNPSSRFPQNQTKPPDRLLDNHLAKLRRRSIENVLLRISVDEGLS
jgi:hypothetical protein